jgi:hypothetical protein
VKLLAFFLALPCVVIARTADPLPSWNDTAPKKAILTFVEQVTKDGSPDFVPPAERIAVFDNDGTLWAEQPMYFQAFFIFDRIKALAPQHPEWKDKEPFASVLKGDVKARAGLRRPKRAGPRGPRGGGESRTRQGVGGGGAMRQRFIP